MNHSNAEAFCENLDSSLLQIKSVEEQIFFSSFLFQNRSIVENVWLGGNRTSDAVYNWTDENEIDGGNQMNYTNWLAGHPLPITNTTTNKKDCMQMEPSFDLTGKWISVACRKLAIPVCLKYVEWDQHKLRHEMTILQNKIKALQTGLNQLQADAATKQGVEDVMKTFGKEVQNFKDNPVPKGFIYVQFHYQATSNSLWPRTSWEDITSNYAGHFFRALGGGAASFGTSQGDNSPRLTRVNSAMIGARGNEVNQVSVPIGGTSGRLWTGDDRPGIDALLATSFTTSGGEVRPKNYGIKIWKRV
jgi:hypothetical protein